MAHVMSMENILSTMRELDHHADLLVAAEAKHFVQDKLLEWKEDGLYDEYYADLEDLLYDACAEHDWFIWPNKQLVVAYLGKEDLPSDAVEYLESTGVKVPEEYATRQQRAFAIMYTACLAELKRQDG